MLYFMHNALRIISCGVSPLPGNICNEITFSKNLCTNFKKIRAFIIIYTNKNRAIICQQILCQLQPRINHIEPIGMETAIALGVGHKTVAFFIILTAIIHIVRRTLGKIILIDKIVTRIIRRINVDHLDLTQIGFLQELQHFQIIALDVEVLTVKTAGYAIFAHTVSCHRTQRCRNGRIGRQHRLFLIWPSKLIAFLPTFYDRIGKLLPQNVKINGVFYLAITLHLGNCIGEQLADQFYISFHAVKAVHFQFVHFRFPPR